MAIEFAKELDCIEFFRTEERQLRARIDRSDRDLSPIELSRPEQAILDDRTYRTMSGNYRLSWAALAKLSQALGNGCCALLFDLLGKKSERPSFPLAAVKIYNELVRVRFRSCLMDRQLIVDRNTDTIVSVAAADYRMTSNSSILDLFDSLKSNTTEFYGGVIVGTRASLEYLTRSGECDELPDYLNPVSFGFVLDLDEGGQSGFRLLRTVRFGDLARLVRGADSSQLAQRVRRSRENRVKAYLSLAEQPVEGNPLELIRLAMSTSAMVTPLGITADRVSENDRIEKKLVRDLRRMGITESMAKQVYRRTLQSAGKEKVLPGQLDLTSRHEWARRTYRDLYISIAADAAERPYNVPARLSAEKLVYSAFFGERSDPYASQDTPSYGRARERNQ